MKKTFIKKSLAVLLAMLLIVSFAACGSDDGGKKEDPPKSDLATFTSKDGYFQIQLPKGWEEDEMEGYEVFLFTDFYAVSVTREEFEVLDSYGLCNADSTLEDYIALIEEGKGIEFTTDSCGNAGVTYENTVDGETYYYYTTARKGSDAFYLISLFCFAEDKAEYGPKFEKWADTVVVK